MAIKLKGFAPETVQQEAENLFGEIIGAVISSEQETLFTIKRREYPGDADNAYMTIKYHVNSKFYFGYYDLTRTEAMQDLFDYSDKKFPRFEPVVE